MTSISDIVRVADTRALQIHTNSAESVRKRRNILTVTLANPPDTASTRPTMTPASAMA